MISGFHFLDDDDWQAWFRLSPQERWRETQKLWDIYLRAAGSLDPEPDLDPRPSIPIKLVGRHLTINMDDAMRRSLLHILGPGRIWEQGGTHEQ
jgi:hypothetical protein